MYFDDESEDSLKDQMKYLDEIKLSNVSSDDEEVREEISIKHPHNIVCIEFPNNNKAYINFQKDWSIRDLIKEILRSKEYLKLFPHKDYVIDAEDYISIFDLELVLLRKIKTRLERRIDFDAKLIELMDQGFLKTYKTPFFSFCLNRNPSGIDLTKIDEVLAQKEFFFAYKDFPSRVDAIYSFIHYPQLENFYHLSKNPITELVKLNLSTLASEKGNENWFVYDDESLGFLMEMNKTVFPSSNCIRFSDSNPNAIYLQDKLPFIILSNKEYSKFLIIISKGEFTMTFSVHLLMTARELMAQMNRKLEIMSKAFVFNADQMILKVKSQNDFVYELDVPLGRFTYIHNCIKNRETPTYVIIDSPFIIHTRPEKHSELLVRKNCNDFLDNDERFFRRTTECRGNMVAMLKRTSLNFSGNNPYLKNRLAELDKKELNAIHLKNPLENPKEQTNSNKNKITIETKLDQNQLKDTKVESVAGYSTKTPSRIQMLSQFFSEKSKLKSPRNIQIKLETSPIKEEEHPEPKDNKIELQEKEPTIIKETKLEKVESEILVDPLEDYIKTIENSIFEKLRSDVDKTKNSFNLNDSIKTANPLDKAQEEIEQKNSRQNLKCLSPELKGGRLTARMQETITNDLIDLDEIPSRKRAYEMKSTANIQEQSFSEVSRWRDTIISCDISRFSTPVQDRMSIQPRRSKSPYLSQSLKFSSLHRDTISFRTSKSTTKPEESVLTLSDKIVMDYLPFIQLPIDVNNLKRPFTIKVQQIIFNEKSIKNFLSKHETQSSILTNERFTFSLSSQLLLGREKLSEERVIKVNSFSFSNDSMINIRVDYGVKYSELPLCSSILFNLKIHGINSLDEPMTISWVNFRLYDHKNQLKTGSNRVSLWDSVFSDSSYFLWQDSPSDISNNLYIKLEDFVLPVEKAIEEIESFKINPMQHSINQSDMKIIRRIRELTPFDSMSDFEKSVLWTNRYALCNYPELIPNLFQCINPKNTSQLSEINKIVSSAKYLQPIRAIQLLNGNFLFEPIRTYAVKCFQAADNSQITDFLIQLVQALKYESNHNTPLAHFLLRNAVKYPCTIGHALFWNLKSEMYNTTIQQRFGLYLEVFLSKIGKSIYRSFEDEVWLVNKLLDVADIPFVPEHKEKKDKLKKAYEDALQKVSDEFLSREISLPINFKLRATGLIPSECKIMKSKKKPLWLVFSNADPEGEKIIVMFKKGDDLRQDILTIQLFRIMHSLWFEQRYNLKMSLYSVVATGYFQGMLEIVTNSETLATVHKAYGGMTAAFSSKPLKYWLQENVVLSEKEYTKNFLLSCAAYCMATYVLGIGDRHNDNIMVKKNGELFHIDFGHFLGHFKKKYGIKRERAPFVYTSEFLTVLKGNKSPE